MRFSRVFALYRHHFKDHRRERMVLASVSFFFTFGTARLLVHGFKSHNQPFELWIGGIHVHHYVWGVALLLLVGYLWLIQVGTGATASSHRLGRMTALFYGVGAALTLDEFALWLHLDDVYWERTGRASIDAVFLFGAIVSAGLWGGPFWRALLRQVARVWRRNAPQLAPPNIPGPTPEGAEAAVRKLEEILLPPDLAEPAPVQAVVSSSEPAASSQPRASSD
jgi:hypothetical protein